VTLPATSGITDPEIPSGRSRSGLAGSDPDQLSHAYLSRLQLRIQGVDPGPAPN
jgi:hypothetical protein